MIELPKPPKINFLRRAFNPLWKYLARSQLSFGPGIRYSETGLSGIFIDVDTKYIPAYQFKPEKVGSNKIKICSGYLIFPEGVSTPLVSNNTKVDETTPFTITENGSIFLKLTYTLSQQSHTSALDAGGSSAEHHLTMWRLNEITFVEYEFLTSPPGFGTDPVTPFSTGDLYYEMCNIEYNAALNDARVVNTIVRGPIQLPDLTEGKLSTSYTPPP